MAITALRLQHYRSYDDSTFKLSSGVNIIVGPNASGKTNLLEAVLLVARGSSYRAKDAELVQFGQPWARIDARDNVDESGTGRTVKIELQDTSSDKHFPSELQKRTAKKSFELEGKKFLRMSQQKSLPAVLFEPNHLLLLSGSPELRRSYLDDLLEQTVAGFGPTRRQYRRVLAQRNALLKQGSDVASRQIFVWNIRLSELAGKIVRQRLALIARLNEMAGEVYSEISHTQATLQLEYISTLGAASNYESALLQRYEHNLERDCMLGFTTAGPHRDDLRAMLNGHVSQETASRGEVRTIILALKTLELQLLQTAFAAKGQSPILLLDDVFSELDASRRQALTAFLQPYQTFITTTDADVVARQFVDGCTVISTV